MQRQEGIHPMRHASTAFSKHRSRLWQRVPFEVRLRAVVRVATMRAVMPPPKNPIVVSGVVYCPDCARVAIDPGRRRYCPRCGAETPEALRRERERMGS